MAYDLLSKKTSSRDWSCGKSAAELWDEAESQRLHHTVHRMAPVHSRNPTKTEQVDPALPNSDIQLEPKTPWGWILGVGTAIVGLTFLKDRPKTEQT